LRLALDTPKVHFGFTEHHFFKLLLIRVQPISILVFDVDPQKTTVFGQKAEVRVYVGWAVMPKIS
jgi:hypothetical protein